MQVAREAGAAGKPARRLLDVGEHSRMLAASVQFDAVEGQEEVASSASGQERIFSNCHAWPQQVSSSSQLAFVLSRRKSRYPKPDDLLRRMLNTPPTPHKDKRDPKVALQKKTDP
jgi:hypothetical protein